MKKNPLISAILGGVMTISMASSAFANMSVPNGWYIEGNVGANRVSDKTYPANTSVNSSGAGANVNLGYKFLPYMGLEVGYTRYADTVIKNNVGTKAARDKHYSVDLALKGILPVVDSGFEAFAKIGINRMNSSTTISDTNAATALGIADSNRSANGIYLGLGAQYYFMPEFAVVGQWQRAKGSSSTGTMDLISIGLSFIYI